MFLKTVSMQNFSTKAGTFWHKSSKRQQMIKKKYSFFLLLKKKL